MVVVTPRLTRRDDCVPSTPSDGLTDRLNSLLSNGGPNFVLSLCPSQTYNLTGPLKFTSPNQEISTQGFPTDSSRATLLVSGAPTDESAGGQSTAILGNCDSCSGIKIRHIQINGNRQGAPPINGGANIEIGGGNADQLVEFVHSYDPRSWSCLHLAEGPFTCTGATIQNNDIGPAGSDAFQQWADGISVSCQNTIVRNNMINNPTDGGIVLFGAPGSQVYNNTIWVETHTLLGGINMVDYAPWSGNYSGTTVYNNTIMGAFSDDASPEAGQKDGTETHQIMIKIGIAIGPRTWFGDQYGWNLSTGGTVRDNVFTGAFGYAMAIGSAADFTVQSNLLVGNTSFIGADGPNCTTGADAPPTPAAFVFDRNGTTGMNVQDGFEDIQSADGLTCVMPPPDGDYWPFGGNPSDPGKASSVPSSSTPTGSPSSAHGGTSGGAKAGIAIGVILGVALFGAILYFVPKWARKQQAAKRRLNQY